MAEAKTGNTLKKASSLAGTLLLWIAGTFLYAVGVVYFVTPMQITAGGMTGLGIIINHLFSFVPTGAVSFALNAPLFIIAWKLLGIRFIGDTIIATALQSLFIDLLTKYGSGIVLYDTKDKLLGAVFSGVLAGIGVGLVMLTGATTGGFGILARILRVKFRHISIGRMILFSDFAVVMLTGIVYKSINSILYSLVVIFLASLAIDYVIKGRSNSKMMLIMTTRPDEVTSDIISECGRGVSVIHAKGGYTQDEKDMLMCVVRPNEVAKVRKLIAKYDDNPFITITDSSEVLGHGFKSNKDTL